MVDLLEDFESFRIMPYFPEEAKVFFLKFPLPKRPAKGTDFNPLSRAFVVCYG